MGKYQRYLYRQRVTTFWRSFGRLLRHTTFFLCSKYAYNNVLGVDR